MPVQNSNHKIYACSADIATPLHQILKPTLLNSLLCHKGQFALRTMVLEDRLLGKYLVINPKSHD